MAQQLTYANALKVLGKQDRPLLDAAERLANGGLAAAGVGNLFGLRRFLVRQGRKALQNLGDKLQGTGRLSRTRRIEAAHQVLLVISFFDPLDLCLSDAGVRLRGEDLEVTADEQWALLGRVLRSESVHSPDGDFVWDQDDLFERAEAVFTEASVHLLRLVRGLAATGDTGTDTGHGSRLATALRQDLPGRALTAYSGHYIRLCAQVPEFGMWAQLREHEQTRRRVSDAFAGLREELTRIASGRPVGALRRTLSLKYGSLLDRPILPVDDILPQDLPPGMVIPSLRDCYVPPSARVARVGRREDPSAEEWWRERETLPDLQRFLASRLTHPDAVRYPTVLLGEPGAGKSKLTEVLAAQLPEEDFLTVRVELRSVNADADVYRQIVEGLEREHRDRITWPELLDEAEGALPVVILDGFDELLQASGMDRHNYLEQIEDFQRHQEVVEQPVAVIVTSRTLSAGRVRFPEKSTVIRLEPFDHEQIGRVLNAWNTANWRLFGSTGLRELRTDRLMEYPELSRQPLLLLLLLVYDAQDNALQRTPASLSLGELYERLLTTFVHRQIRKHRAESGEREFKREVQRELHRLEVTALAMFTRQRQNVGAEELSADLREFRLAHHHPQTEGGPRPRSKTAHELLGRFFFMHVSRARVTGAEEGPQSAYEFLHATFGEYLVARMVHRALRSLVNDRVRHEEEDSWGEQSPGDGVLYATSSFSCYRDRERTLDFLKELVGKDIDGDEERRAHYGALLIELFRRAPYPPTNRSHSTYQPRELPFTSRQAYYTANLLTLLLIAQDKAVDIGELFTTATPGVTALQQWRATASLWRTLPGSEWFTILDTLRLRHLANGRSVLRLEDHSRVNVGESMGFELRGDPDLHSSVLDPYAMSTVSFTPTGQMLRSMALRVNGTAALLTMGVLPHLEVDPSGLGVWAGPWDTGGAPWSPGHELLLLRLLPDETERTRRLAAYRRFLWFDDGMVLGRTGLLVLRQAAEDLSTLAPDNGHRVELLGLVTTYLTKLVEMSGPRDRIEGEEVASTAGGGPDSTEGRTVGSTPSPRVTVRPEEIGAVLDLLTPHLSPASVERVKRAISTLPFGVGADTPSPAGLPAPARSNRDEHSVVDLEPFSERAPSSD